MDTKVKNPENGATGKSNIEGKTATGSSERSGSRASFNHGSSRIEFRHHDFRPVSFSKHSCHPRQPWSSSLLSVNIRVHSWLKGTGLRPSFDPYYKVKCGEKH